MWSRRMRWQLRVAGCADDTCQIKTALTLLLELYLTERKLGGSACLGGEPYRTAKEV